MAGTKRKSSLVPIDLANQDQFDQLQSQRRICSWDYETNVLREWQESMKSGTKSMFWITLWPETPSDEDGTSRASEPTESLRVGHISLDSVAHPPDLELANPDKSVLTIATFFILPEHRAGGYGRAAMVQVEQWATKEPHGSLNCKAVALSTFNGKFSYPGSDEIHDYYADPRAGNKPSFSNIEWYSRLGYKRWKEEPRYPYKLGDGTDIVCRADFMKKDLV
jgi:GNAT superfamily N-acetyltransferase